MSKKVFIYARRSSLKNKGESISIKSQIKDLENECEKKGLQIEGIYSDNESSYNEGKRDEFNKMLDEITKRNIKNKGERIDYLYVFMTSRLARNRKEANLIIDFIEEDNLQILSMNETYEEGLKGQKRLIDDLTFAIYESKEKSEKSKKNLDFTQRDGGKISRKPAFGYKMEIDEYGYKTMVINNDNKEGEVVKEAFRYYSTGNYTYEGVAEVLNNLGYSKVDKDKEARKTTFRNFTKSDIENIIINQVYYGKITNHYTKLTNAEIEYFQDLYPDISVTKEVIIDYTDFIKECGTFIPLISATLYEKCSDIRGNKKGKTKKIDDPTLGPIYLFRTLLKCPCKKDTENYHRYTQEEKIHPKYFSKTYYYKCSGGNKKCYNKSISEKQLEKIIIDKFINEIIFNKTEIKIFEEIIYNELKKLGKIKENAGKLLKVKLNNLKKEDDKQFKLYSNEEDEDFKNDYKKIIKKIRNEITEVENQLLNLPNIENDREKYIKDYIYYINELGTNFEHFPKNRRQKLIKAFFEYIVIDKPEKNIINIIDYKLNPIFELAYNKKKVLSSVKNNNNSNNTKSNLTDGLPNNKISNSDVYVLNGSLTRNRT